MRKKKKINQPTFAQKKETRRKAPKRKNPNSSPSLGKKIDHILQLQQTIGNQAVQRMIKSGALQLDGSRMQKKDEYPIEVGELAQRVRMSNVETRPQTQTVMRQQGPAKEKVSIEPGDVVVRAGTFSGYNPLVSILGEDYNHGGVALNSSQVHHVESNGYETVSVDNFFHPDNASGGAVVRFQGPFAAEIRARVVEIARAQRYVKIPGNPFSTAENLETVNCNEFIHELFRQAIAELMSEAQKNNINMFQQLLAEYGDPGHAGQVKKLIKAKTVEYKTGGFTTGPAVGIGEYAGKTGVSKEAKERGEVLIKFEGKLEMRNLYPDEWAKCWWNPLKVKMYSEGFYTVAVLRTYTPGSFINSGYFKLVRRLAKRK